MAFFSHGNMLPSLQGAATAITGRIGATFLRIIRNATNPNFQLTVTADQFVMLDTGDNSIVARPSATLTPDITVAGVNGLDTGSEGASTWYGIHAIWNGTTLASLLSISATAPTMPTGYTHRAFLGWVRNDASSNFVDFEQLSPNVQLPTNIKVVNDGGSTTTTSFSVATGVPPSRVSMVHFRIIGASGSSKYIGADTFANTLGETGHENTDVEIAWVGNTRGYDFWLMLTEAQTIYLQSGDAGTCDIHVIGFTLHI